MSALDSARDEIDRAEAEIRRQQIEAARLAEEREKRQQMVRTIAQVGAVLLTLGLIALAYWLNLRRRDEKEAATQLYQNWTTHAREQTDRLFALLDRSSSVVGSAANLTRKGYKGRTLTLSQNIIEDVDELFIMSSCVRRILDEVRDLLRPNSPFHWLLNLFSPENYNRALHRLQIQPIQFKPEDGVEPILREERGEEERPLGSLASHESFELSFPALVQAFDDHAVRARENLDVVEHAWGHINSRLETLDQDITVLAQRADSITQDSTRDGFFPLPSLSDVLIPAARTKLEEAVQQAPDDPVGALEEPVAEGRRIIDDGVALAEMVESSRKSQFPELREHQESLEKLEVSTGWLTEHLDQYSAHADALAKMAPKDAISESIQALAHELEELSQTARRAVKLSKRSRKKSAERITALEKDLASARRDIGKALDQPAKKVLIENNHNPDDLITAATQQHQAARHALDRGDVSAAEAALEAVVDHTERGLFFIEETRRSLESHPTRVEEIRAYRKECDKSVPDHESRLSSLQSLYLPTALYYVRDESETTVSDNISDSKKHLSAAKEVLDQADRAFAEARLLEAASLLDEADHLIQGADEWLKEIRDHQTDLKRNETENDHDSSRLADRLSAMESQAVDDRTMESTVQAYGDLLNEYKLIAENHKAKVKDPFDIAERFHQLTVHLDEFSERVQSDWKLFEEASQSLRAAHSQLKLARELVRKSQTDQIPDSPKTKELRQEIADLEKRLELADSNLKKSHADWMELDAEADRIAADGGRAAAALRDELEQAEASVRAISSASSDVRSTAGWSGRFGVSVVGTPGADSLEQARQFLLSGSYLAAQRHAEEATATAQRALAMAQAEVARRRRAEEARKEAARRAAAERRRRRSRSSSSSFGGGMSRSTFSSGSSMSRGSFSSGSGMSRSGW